MKRPAVRGITEHRRLLVAALVVLVAVIGVLVWRLVDQGGGGGTRKVKGTPAEVVNLVTGLQRALAGRDYQTICDSLFTTAAREAAGAARGLAASAGQRRERLDRRREIGASHRPDAG